MIVSLSVTKNLYTIAWLWCNHNRSTSPGLVVAHMCNNCTTLGPGGLFSSRTYFSFPNHFCMEVKPPCIVIFVFGESARSMIWFDVMKESLIRLNNKNWNAWWNVSNSLHHQLSFVIGITHHITCLFLLFPFSVFNVWKNLFQSNALPYSQQGIQGRKHLQALDSTPCNGSTITYTMCPPCFLSKHPECSLAIPTSFYHFPFIVQATPPKTFVTRYTYTCASTPLFPLTPYATTLMPRSPT